MVARKSPLSIAPLDQEAVEVDPETIKPINGANGRAMLPTRSGKRAVVCLLLLLGLAMLFSDTLELEEIFGSSDSSDSSDNSSSDSSDSADWGWAFNGRGGPQSVDPFDDVTSGITSP